MFLRNVRGLVLIASAAAILLAATGAPLFFAHPVAAAPAPARIVRLQIDGEIEPILASTYIVHGIDSAAEQHADLILITMDTPGGLDTSMREIIQKILASPVPVVTYVSPTGSRAASAGFFILLSAMWRRCRRGRIRGRLRRLWCSADGRCRSMRRCGTRS